MAKDTVAIDVAFLLPEAVVERAHSLNAAIREGHPESFAFDASHLPHLTLVQQCSHRGDLAALEAKIDAVVASVAACDLWVARAQRMRSSAWWVVDPAAELLELQRRLADALVALSGAPLDETSFVVSENQQDDAERPRPNDIDWVANYHEAASGAQFAPHITVGIGDLPVASAATFEPFGFRAARVALCQLGRHCTCRRLIREWALG